MTSPAPDHVEPAARLAQAASFGLVSARLDPPAVALATPDWKRLVTEVRRERQWGPLAWAIAEEWWPASDTQRAQALAAHRAAMATVLRIEQRLVDLHHRCAERGIAIVVVKGPAVGRLDYPESSLRSFADLDLLLRGPDLRAMEVLLAELGGVRRYEEPRAGFDQRFSKGMSVRLPDGTEIDIHRTLALGPFGLQIRPEEMLDSTVTFDLGGVRVAALDRGGRFLHACVHAALGAATPAMTARRDIVTICEADPDLAPLVASIDRAEHWGIGLVIAVAVHDAAATFNWRPPDIMRDRIDQLQPSRRESAWLDGYRGNRSSTRLAHDSLQAIDGWTDRVRYAAAVLAPQGRTSLTRVRRAVRDLADGGADRSA